MEKFEIDIKWGSYLFITNVTASIVISLLMLLVDYNCLRYLSNILVLVFIVQLIYFTIKALKENKKHDLSIGFLKFFVFTRVFVIYFFMMYLLKAGLHTMIEYPSLIFYHRKKSLSEFLIEDNSCENNGITLDEFIATLKRKFSRS